MGWVVNATPRPLTLGKETRYALYRSLRGPQGRSGRVRDVLPTTGIRSQDRPGSNESLHRLQYAGRLTQQGMRESLRCTGNFTGLLTDRFLSFSPPLQANSVIEPQIRHRPPPHTSFPNHRSLVSSCMYLFGDTGGDINP